MHVRPNFSLSTFSSNADFREGTGRLWLRLEAGS
jgi:hypothetical protein